MFDINYIYNYYIFNDVITEARTYDELSCVSLQEQTLL